MRADIHDGPEHILQSETEYIDARLHQPASTNPLAARGRTIHWVKTDNTLTEALKIGHLRVNEYAP